jgi:hypothetical protein
MRRRLGRFRPAVAAAAVAFCAVAAGRASGPAFPRPAVRSGPGARTLNAVASGEQAPSGPVWVKTGGPLGGLGYDVRIRPDNNNIIFVTDAFSGINVSTDGGESWSPSNTGIGFRTGRSGDAIPVFSLTVAPHNSNVI